jgi:EAL domain-containing protein (putative c-di-GMP-specific phosphodiesterase class I)
MELSQRLSSLADSGDYTVARYGGDEFVIIWKGGQLHKNSTILFMLKQMIASPFEYKSNQIFVRISIGIANCSEKDECSMETYFSNADTAMVEAKRAGKNKTVFFTNEMRESIQTKQEITRILENACNSEDGFYVLYQPQIDIISGEIHGYEALCRLKTVKIFPGQFIPVAEESGLITKIGRIMTEQVIKQLVEWRAKGFPLRKVSINYSAAQMADKEYVSFLKTLLEKNALSPSLIEIEITEATSQANQFLSISIIKKLKDRGMRVLMDDFGVGFSNVGNLKKIPFDAVKIDKSVIDDIASDSKAGEIVKFLIGLCKVNGMEVIAEGVDDKEQVEILRRNKCDTIQGFYYSKPLPRGDFEKFIAKNDFEKRENLR